MAHSTAVNRDSMDAYEDHERDLISEISNFGRWLTQEQLDEM